MMAQPVTTPVELDRDAADATQEHDLDVEVPETSGGAASWGRGASAKNLADLGVSVWLRSLDGGSLAQYESVLLGLFENVEQIKRLYADRLQDFFEDVSVRDSNHRLAFASALRALRESVP